MPRPQLKKIEGFEVSYLGPTTTMSIINGKVLNSFSHTFVLTPQKVGRFEIGPFSFNLDGRIYKSNKIEIEVLGGPVQLPEEEMGIRRPELGDRAFLTLTVGKSRLYLNEIAPVVVKLYLNGLSARDIQYPEFESNFFSIGEFGEPRQYQENISGAIYDVIEFRTDFFPAKAGDFKFGPAELKCNILAVRKKPGSEGFPFIFRESLFDDFFNNYVKYPLTLKTPQVDITVLPFPESGRPDNFTGAIGDFEFNMEVSPVNINVGDPLTLKMEISGKGNFNSVFSPVLSRQEGFKIYEPLSQTKKGKKTFEQVLIPLSKSVKEIPPVYFSYFDPEKEEYVTLMQGPVAINVTEPLKEEMETMEIFPGGPIKKEVIGEDIIYIKDKPGRLRAIRKKPIPVYKNKLLILTIILPALSLVFLYGYARRRERIRTDIRYARFIRARRKARDGLNKARLFLYKSSYEEFYGIIYKTLREYIGDKLGIPSAGITLYEIDDIFSRVKLNPAVISEIKEIFTECDIARFWPASVSTEKMRHTLSRTEQVIKSMERMKL